MGQFFEWLLTNNSTGARILRTIIQGLLGVIVAELPEIVGLFNVPDWVQAMIVAAIMAILSPIMSELGKHVEMVNAEKRFRLANSFELEDEAKYRGCGEE